jgi:hypothetical protein
MNKIKSILILKKILIIILGGIKLISKKNYFFIMNYVNGYVIIIIISIILGFIVLRNISLNYSKKNHNNIKKMKKIYIFLINLNYFFANYYFSMIILIIKE